MVIGWPRSCATMRGLRWRIFTASPAGFNLSINPLITELLPAPSGPSITIFNSQLSFDACLLTLSGDLHSTSHRSSQQRERSKSPQPQLEHGF